MNLMNIVSKRLKELRLEKQLSQSKLAKILICSQTIISQWENGTRTPTIYEIVAIADYFGVTTDYLLGRED